MQESSQHDPSHDMWSKIQAYGQAEPSQKYWIIACKRTTARALWWLMATKTKAQYNN